VANDTLVYRVDVERILARKVPLSPSSEDRVPLLAMVQDRVAILGARGSTLGADYRRILEDIDGFLLNGTCGLESLLHFPRLHGLTNDIHAIADHLAEPLKSRWLQGGSIEGSDFPAMFDQRLKVLDFPGWKFFNDVEVLQLASACREILSVEELVYRADWERFVEVYDKELFEAVLFVYMTGSPSFAAG